MLVNSQYLGGNNFKEAVSCPLHKLDTIAGVGIMSYVGPEL